jgi:L-alanine-DL-glutamate epimerase-like enolase superfamily enzyme
MARCALVRLTDVEGAEGVGYTHTAGRNGAAVHAILEHEIAGLFGGKEADEIERIWRKAWWACIMAAAAVP